MSASPLQGRRTLVLGASGFIGRWVVRALVERGAEVLGQVRDPQRMPADFARGATLVTVELEANNSARELVERKQPDVVFNLAGYGVAKDERREWQYKRLNVWLVQELASALRPREGWSGSRLIQVGSALEYGPGSSLDELAPSNPTELYGITKSVATLALSSLRRTPADLQAPSVVVRPFTVFGLGERPGRLVPTLLAARATTTRIPLSAGTQQRDFIYVEDVARALVELAELPGETACSGRYPFDAPCLNLASGALTPVRDFVLAFADEFGLARERLGFGDLPPLPEEMHHPPVPVARLQAALGWSPSPDPRDGLRRMRAHLEDGLA
jgi:nucleoside-diphosphate-sugar epimerase